MLIVAVVNKRSVLGTISAVVIDCRPSAGKPEMMEFWKDSSVKPRGSRSSSSLIVSLGSIEVALFATKGR
jgi:hypothetical protein